MSKTINFEFWQLNIIDENNDKKIPFNQIIKNLEKKSLNVSDENHRYYCHNKSCYRAISYIEKLNNSILINFSKFENKDIKGGFLENGADEFDAIEALKKAKKRDDVSIKEYNRVIMYTNNVVIFEVDGKANTMKQLKEYLEFHCEEDYKIEIVPIYKNELFDEIDNGNIHDITLSIGFQPNGSFNHLEEESYTGALNVEIKLKKGKDNFLKNTALKAMLLAKKMTGFGSLDKGMITDAKVKISNKVSGKKITVSLDQYQLKEQKVFKEVSFYYMEPNKFFNDLYNKHSDFLEEYISRDIRY